MSVGTVITASSNAAQQALRTQSERAEVGPDHDGDADDGGVSGAATAAIKPTVNLQGQAIGAVVNTKA
jgi:hypothetical protein